MTTLGMPPSDLFGEVTSEDDPETYVALAAILHTTPLTAKRWMWAWAYGASQRVLFRILQNDDNDPFFYP